jgi:hypothetical protein
MVYSYVQMASVRYLGVTVYSTWIGYIYTEPKLGIGISCIYLQRLYTIVYYANTIRMLQMI